MAIVVVIAVVAVVAVAAILVPKLGANVVASVAIILLSPPERERRHDVQRRHQC